MSEQQITAPPFSESEQPPVEVSETADEVTESAPYGYTTDPKTGERRPKKSPGRPRKAEGGAPAGEPVLGVGSSPSLEDLKAAGSSRAAGADRSPDDQRKRPRGKRARAAAAESKPDTPVPPFRAGPIAKGVNRLYRRAGRFVRALDPAIGTAIIEATKKDDDDDTTVGEAWEEIAKSNPRIRGFLLSLIESSAWGDLVSAHIPILLAILMKEGIRKRLPFMRLVTAFLDDDEDGPTDISAALGGLQSGDVQEMMGFAQQMMNSMAMNVPRTNNAPRMSPTVVDYVEQPGSDE